MHLPKPQRLGKKKKQENQQHCYATKANDICTSKMIKQCERDVGTPQLMGKPTRKTVQCIEEQS